MNVLNGSKDLTLVEFLMGLASSGETAEYIQLYLGSSSAGKAAVAAFTTEFLKYASLASLTQQCLPTNQPSQVSCRQHTCASNIYLHSFVHQAAKCCLCSDRRFAFLGI